MPARGRRRGRRAAPAGVGSGTIRSPGLRSLARLARAELALSRTDPGDADVVVVGYPGHADMGPPRGASPTADPSSSTRSSLWRTPSSTIAAVVSGGLRLPPSSAALDRARFAGQTSSSRTRRPRRVLQGRVRPGPAQPHRRRVRRGGGAVFRPGGDGAPEFHVLFVGKLIPLHGLETILAAARLVPDDSVRDRRGGPARGSARARPAAQRRLDSLGGARANPAGDPVCGVFARDLRRQREGGQGDPEQSVPGAGVRRPVVTADTLASRELLVDGQSAVLVPPGDAAALASAIRRLAADIGLCERIAEGGLRVYRERASEDVLGARWRAILERVIASARDARAPRSPR